MSDIKVDPEFRTLVFPLTEAELTSLEESLLTEGCRDALVTWRGLILDGHHRLEVCQKHGIEFETKEIELEDREAAKIWIIKNQFARRNLTLFQRAELALKLEPLIAEKAKGRQRLGGKEKVCQKSDKAVIDTKRELASIAGVSHDTIWKVKKIQESGTDKDKKALNDGKETINSIYKNIEKKEKIKEIEGKIKEYDFIPGKYDVVILDPPWKYGREYDSKSSRVASPFPEQDKEEIFNDCKDFFKDNCVLWLWTTHKFIWQAKELLEEWGFSYKAILVWNKEKMGMGIWLRMQCEFCLLGIKGKPEWNLGNERDVISEAGRQHSRKPEKFYKMVKNLCGGSIFEYYSRELREGIIIQGVETEEIEQRELEQAMNRMER